MSKKKVPPKKKPKAPAAGLTPKQQRFVAEYLVDLNATRAAITAGYSAKTAESQASRLLRNVKVAEAVEAGKTRQLAKAEVTAERVLAEIAKLCFSDARALFREDGSLKRPTEWDDEVAAAVAGVDVVEMAGGAAIGKGGALQHVPMYTKKVKLWDKKGSLELLAKHFGILKEKVEHSGSISFSWQDEE